MDKNNYILQNITETLEVNYMPYAMSVIISRAIPEIDGFKPAHRKLLYTMYKMGLINSNRTKSTNVIGQTMKLNPHGDSSIYETLVRLTKGNASLLHPFIDSKGNFGKQFSRDMAYAASRYTEVKLDEICTQIFKNIEKDTVDFIDNYDGSMKEPILFPTTFPNILVTNNQGIAVSMASSICSFNLKEVCLTTINFIKNPNINLLEYLKAPDFSTGGQLIYNENEIKKIYETGKGSFKLRAKYKHDKKNNLIEVYEIPYTTTVEAVIDKIISLVKLNKIKEINDIRNETDKNGLKIAIDIKRNTDPDILMHKLFSMTTLQDNFNCNFNILINQTPKTVGIKEILKSWLDFRIKCIERQIIYDLNKKNEKFHLLDGLSKILVDIDRVIKIIRSTEQDELVVPNLQTSFNITIQQAEYISEIKLRNLNKQYLLNRINEKDNLKSEIGELKKTLKNKEKIKDIICEELKEVSKKYGKNRITEIIYDKDIKQMSQEDLILDYQVKLFLTKENYFKKITLASIRSYSEHKLKENDFIIQEIDTTNKSEIIFISDKANIYKSKVYEILECKASNIGQYLPNLLEMEENENIIYFIAFSEIKGYILFCFENGKIAKVPLSNYETKVNRKKLVNVYNNKYNIAKINFIEKDTDIILKTENSNKLLLNTLLIPERTNKNTLGVQVLNFKNKDKIKDVILERDFQSKTIEKNRINNIPFDLSI